jgi:aminoglycoside phosphotransferase (APT) family kinase protein
VSELLDPTDRDPTEQVSMITHRHDLDRLGRGLAGWLRRPLDADADIELSGVHVPDGRGLSSVTLLAEASWTTRGTACRRKLVVRLAPDDTSFPVFPAYDMRLQSDVMTGVRARTDVPVPRVLGLDESGEVIGTPFLVMDHVEGRTPVDNPPYVFCGWLHDATPEQRARLQDATIDVLARIHDLPEPATLVAPATDVHPLRAHVDRTRAYYDWTLREDGLRIPILERAFDWIEAHWPTDPGETVLSWGDARPGNILYQEFTPCAVLDWEMAALGPRELDLGWFIFIHRFFQDIAEAFDLPGLPDLAHPEDVAASYRARTGHAVRDLDWYIVYAALRHGVVMCQIKRRMIHFGEDTVPADVDDYVLHRAALAKLLDGSYEWPAS